MEEPTCRVCLLTDGQFIRPCHCRSFIHRECLDQWRALNRANAYFRCEVCHFEYRYRQVLLAAIVRSTITKCLLSIICLIVYGFSSGYLLAKIVNALWSFFMHQPSYLPHNLQVLFYSLVSIAIPGIYLLGRDFIRAAPVLGAREINVPGIRLPYVYIGDSRPTVRPVEPDNKSAEEPESKTEESKSKPKKVAPYEAPSTLAWIAVILFAARSSYAVYSCIETKIDAYCARAQELIENI